ncbi:PQQ-binding-like beta-propeller repeat protein [Salinisphaera sp. T31B1]|uniref:PQQ-binding-like beta-propeller repeat protein n=1 Tax=Salinisphaera sp. T31B1 TaxID=727963 RepID=UPI00333E8C8C
MFLRSLVLSCRLQFIGLLLIGLALAVPARADWLQYRDGADRNAVVDTQLAAPTDRVSALPTPDEVRATPTVYDGDLLVGNHLAGALQRIDPATGTDRWSLNAPNWVHSEIVWAGKIGVVGYGNRYFPSDDDPNEVNYVRGTGASGVIALDLDDGTVRWRYRTIGEVMPTPVIDQGRVYAATGDRAVHVLDLNTGRQLGLIRLGSFVSMSSPALDTQGRLFVGGGDPYRLFCIDPVGQTVVWHSDFPDMIGGVDDVPPAVAGDTVYTTGVIGTDRPDRFDHRLYAIDAATGQRRWEVSLGIGGPVKNNRSGAPVVAEDRVVVGSPTSKSLQAFTLDGTRLWRLDSGAMKAPVVIHDGTVYAVNAAGEILVVDLASGTLRKRYKLSDKPLAPAGPVLVGQHLVVPAQDKHVYLVPLALLNTPADDAGR